MAGNQRVIATARGRRPVRHTGKMPEGEILAADRETVAKMRTKRQGNWNNVGVHYSRELADEICWRVASGESLYKVCEDPHMPSETTVRFWAIEDRDGFASKYALAREALMEKWSEDIVTIADDATLEPNDRRVRTENRRWLMSKLAWKRYGDKLTHSGDPQNPIQHNIAVVPLGGDELEALNLLARSRLLTIEHDPQD